mmetsp:Transcript_44256/g.103471  ORF Transcript_44256/g.103471 Transcript_44256/m.103471 type:complete len:150 (-) Transcript_44256:74-523(-)
MEHDTDVPPPPPPPPPPAETVVEEEVEEPPPEPHWRDRNMEASKRAAPGDTARELSALLAALGTESPRSSGAAKEKQVEEDPKTPLEEPVEEVSPGREDRAALGERSSCASRRAAPGDTLREELRVMRLGAEADAPALERHHTQRGRGR